MGCAAILWLWLGVGLVFVIQCVVCLLRYGIPRDFRAFEIAVLLGVLLLGWPVIFIVGKGPRAAKEVRRPMVVGSGHSALRFPSW
jgi:hypothetical protein